MVLLRRLPVDWVWVVAEGWHGPKGRVKCWLWNLELLRLLSGPASMPHEFGFLFILHSLRCLFLLRTLIGPMASIYPMEVAV